MPKKIGMLTPSSNTLLEPVCSRMLSAVDEVTCHYSRFPVTHISLAQSSTDQFRLDPMLQAAELLAHAEVDVIAWNGASGSWLGLEADRILCERITEATGIPATTATLALMEVARANGARTCHLITPYSEQQNALIAENYGGEAIRVVNARGANRTINKDIGAVPFEEIDRMFAEVMRDPVDGVFVPCTNFPLILSIEDFEARYSCVVYDTIGAVMWKSMVTIGADPTKIVGWGSLFRTSVQVAYV
jgi:maleate isomerase